MNKRVTVMMVVVLGLMALAGSLLGCAGGSAGAEFEPAATAATTTDLSAGLVGSVLSPEVSGRAAYDVDRGGEVELEVAVRAASAAAGRTMDVFINGAPAGRVTLDDNGRGTLRADSEDGQAVPTVTAGSTIEVRQDDQVVASGQFSATDDADADANDNGNDDNTNGDDNANDNSDDNANDNGDDNANDNANDNGDDDNANDNSDDNANDNGDDNANDNGDDDDDNDNGDDDDDDDNSGSGNDDDDDNSGSGNGDDDNDNNGSGGGDDDDDDNANDSDDNDNN
jgi:hypothetical protein